MRNLTGVEGVVNLVTIKLRTTPFEVKGAIRKALQRTATEDANRITVEVEDGVVKLNIHPLLGGADGC